MQMADKKTQARDRSNSKLDIHIPRYHRRVIENECSMARDQFACERNFLSWFKFSMALASSGAVVFNEFSKKQKQNINSAGNPGGAHDKNIELANASTVFFLVLAMIVLVFSAVYMWGTKIKLATDKKPMRLFWPMFLPVMGAVVAASLIFVLAFCHHKLKL